MNRREALAAIAAIPAIAALPPVSVESEAKITYRGEEIGAVASSSWDIGPHNIHDDIAFAQHKMLIATLIIARPAYDRIMACREIRDAS